MDNPLLVVTVVLCSISLAGAILTAALVLRRRDITPHEIGSAVSGEWVRLRLGEAIGQVQSEAAEIRKAHTTLEQMLRTPSGRGSFGEQSLEVILRNKLPRECYGFRKECFDGKIPDAHIRAGEELICIDSKFPSANLHKLMACSDDKEKALLFKRFLDNVKIHLEKVANDYICPEKGTAKFALVFIPSEAIYYSLITDPDGYELLNQYAFRGVQVVSPLLLSHKIEILRLSIGTVRLNECAEEVLGALQALDSRFARVSKAWKLCSSHLRHLEEAATKLDSEFKSVHLAFDRLSKDAVLDGDGSASTESPFPEREGEAPADPTTIATPDRQDLRAPEADLPNTDFDETEGTPNPEPAPGTAGDAPSRATYSLEFIDGATCDFAYGTARGVIVFEHHVFRVLRGSTAVGDMDPHLELEGHASKMLRDQLVNSGKLTKRSDGLYEFSEDVSVRKLPQIVHIATGTAIAADRVLVQRGG